MDSFWRTLDRGTLRDIALVCLADAVVGAAFGAIAVSGGLPVWVPITMSLLVFAGGAQFAAVGVVLSGGLPAAAVAAGLVLNARLLPFGFAVGDVLSGRWWTRLAGAHLLTDEAVAFVLRDDDPRRRRAAYWVCGIGLFVCWNAAVALGALAGHGIGGTAALGLDAAFPAVLLALVLPSLIDVDSRGTAPLPRVPLRKPVFRNPVFRNPVFRNPLLRDPLLRACLLGAAVAVAATPFLPAGLPVLLALTGLVLAAPAPAAGERVR